MRAATNEEIEGLALLRAAEAYGIEWTSETEPRLRKSLVFAGACMRLHAKEFGCQFSGMADRLLRAVDRVMHRRANQDEEH